MDVEEVRKLARYAFAGIVGLGLLSGFIAMALDDPAARKAQIEEAKRQADAEQFRKDEAARVEKARLEAEDKRERVQRDAECRQDLECFAGRGKFYALLYCRRAIERSAEYQMEWTDGFYGTPFPQFRWKDKDKGIVEYRGDKAKFQNGYGAWQNAAYTCVIDVPNEKMIDYTVRAGRI